MNRRILALLFIVICLVASCTSMTPLAAPSWPTHIGGTGGTSEQPAETLINPTTVKRLHGAWTFKQAPDENLADPLVSGTTVVTDTYASPQTSLDLPLGRVIALQLGTGKSLWSKSFPRQVEVDAIWQGVVVVTLFRMYNTVHGQWPYNVLLGLSLKTGAVVWQDNDPQDTQEWESPAVVGGGHLFMQNDKGAAMLDAATGAVSHQSVYAFNRYATYSSGRLFTLDVSQPLFAFDASTGAKLFEGVVLNDAAEYWSQPIGYGPLVYVAGKRSGQLALRSGEVVAYRATGCGQPQCVDTWRTFLPEPIYVSDPLTAENGKVFAVGAFGSVFALDPNTGKLLWRYHGSEGSSSPSSAGEVLFTVNLKDQFLAFNEAGCGAAACQPILAIGARSSDDDYTALGPPVIADGYVLYQTSTGLHALTVR